MEGYIYMDNERATEQLSGRVTDSQKSYIADMQGSFSEKIAELIELHRNRIENDVFTISPNLDAVQKAVNTIVKNLEVIELNANTYVTDYNNQIASKLAVLETEGIEIREIKEENERLIKANETLVSEYDKLSISSENLKKTLENKELKVNDLIEKNNSLLQDKIKGKENIEEIRLNHQEKVLKLEQDLNQKVNEIIELDKKNSVVESQVVSLKEGIGELKNEIKEIKGYQKQEIKDLESGYKVEIEALNKKIENLKEELNNEKLEKQKVEIEIKSKLETKENELLERDKVIDRLNKEIEKFSGDKNTSRKKVNKED